MKKFQLDGNKLLYHLEAVNSWKSGSFFLPPLVSVAISQNCNHQCSFCAYSHRDRSSQKISREQWNGLVKEWRGTTVKAIFFSGDGEPLLNEHIGYFAESAKNSGLAVALNTNGALFKGKLAEALLEELSWVRFSVNGGTPETYERIHGVSSGQFSLVLENIRHAVAYRNASKLPCDIGVQCVATDENRHELISLAKLVRASGVDYFAIKPLLGRGDGVILSEDAMRELEDLSTATFVCRVRATMNPQPRDYPKCLGHSFIAELAVDGGVYGCGPELGNSRFCFGNAFETSFTEVWKSARRQQVIQHIEGNVDVKKCMVACRCDSINRTLWELMTPPAHVDFI